MSSRFSYSTTQRAMPDINSKHFWTTPLNNTSYTGPVSITSVTQCYDNNIASANQAHTGHTTISPNMGVSTVPTLIKSDGYIPTVHDWLPIKEKSTIRKPILMPDPYDGRGNLDDYISHFELCKDLNGWNNETAARFLASKFRGNPLQMYTDMSGSEKRSLDSIYAQLRSRFDPNNNADVYRVELRMRRQKHNESLSDLAGAILRLVNNAYPKASYEQREEFAKDSFINALSNGEVRVQIRRGHPKTLEEAKKFSLEEETFARLDGKERVCFCSYREDR